MNPNITIYASTLARVVSWVAWAAVIAGGFAAIGGLSEGADGLLLVELGLEAALGGLLLALLAAAVLVIAQIEMGLRPGGVVEVPIVHADSVFNETA